jgi:DNA polymerase-3 subunit epsilon
MPRPDLELREAEFIAFDTETTGLYPLASRLVEIGATRFHADGERVADFEQLIDPEMPIPPDAQAVNHITDEMVLGQPTVETVMPAFVDFLGDTDNLLVAHNAPFDLEFLGVDMLRLGLALPRHLVFDTCILAQAVLPGLGSYRLESLAVVLGVASSQHHRALSDAELTRDLLMALLSRTPQVKTVADLAALNPPLTFDRVRVYQTNPPAGMEALSQAIESGTPLGLVYAGGSKGLEPRRVTPRSLLRCRGYVYLAAYCHSDGKNKMYRLDRIVEVHEVLH